MRTFKDYLNRKLENPDFKKQFEQECCICQTVLDAAKIMEEKNISPEAIAHRLTKPVALIQALFDGDHCDPGLIAEIYKELDIPCNCRKL